MIKTHEYSPGDVFRYNGPSIRWTEESNWTVFVATVKEHADVDPEMGFYIVQLAGAKAFIFTENLVKFSTPIELSDLTADDLLAAHPDFFAAVKR